MSDHYTDADVQAAMDAIDNATLADGLGVFETGTVDRVARAFLDVVAPAIAARALREAADGAALALANEVGGHTSTYSVRKWLHSRADKIERT